MTIIIHHHHYHDKDDADRLCRIENQIGLILSNQETFKMSFEDLKAALDSAAAKSDAIKADVEALMAKIAAIPVAGMTPEQEAALAEAVSAAQSLNDKLGAIDAMNP